VLGRRRQVRDLEGSFLYPRRGIGQVTEALAAVCDRDALHTGARVTRVEHDGRAVRSIEVNGERKWPVEAVVSTLPLPLLLHLLDPPPPHELMQLAEGLRYRHVRLVAFFLDRPSVTGAATVYFPDASFPFTRVYEPRNRSAEMAPAGSTSLVAEVPCQDDDVAWTEDDPAVIDRVRHHLEAIGWISDGELIDTCSERLVNAYPVLDTGCEQRVAAISGFLRGFANLHLSGRSGRFVYGWIHTMMRFGREIVEEIAGER